MRVPKSEALERRDIALVEPEVLAKRARVFVGL